jgi:hypothetical protein
MAWSRAFASLYAGIARAVRLEQRKEGRLELRKEGRLELRKAGSTLAEEALREALRKWRRLRSSRQGAEADAAIPACVFGVVVGDRLDSMQGDLEEIRREIAWIRNVIVGAVAAAAIATVLRFMGWVS